MDRDQGGGEWRAWACRTLHPIIQFSTVPQSPLHRARHCRTVGRHLGGSFGLRVDCFSFSTMASGRSSAAFESSGVCGRCASRSRLRSSRARARHSTRKQISGGYAALRVQTEINLKGEPLICSSSETTSSAQPHTEKPESHLQGLPVSRRPRHSESNFFSCPRPRGSIGRPDIGQDCDCYHH
jgi:hypothetical protein